MFKSLVQKLLFSSPSSLLLKKEVRRLADRLGVDLDESLSDEEKAISLLQRISMQIEISRHTPLINKPNNLEALNLKKHPLKQAGLLNYKDFN